MNKFELFDNVQILDKSGRLVKEGLIVELGSSFCRVYDPKASLTPPFTDIIEISEFFPINSQERKMVKAGFQRKKPRK